MQEKKQTGRTIIATNLKKTKVTIDMDGNIVELPSIEDRPKSLTDLMEKRMKRMGR